MIYFRVTLHLPVIKTKLSSVDDNIYKPRPGTHLTTTGYIENITNRAYANVQNAFAARNCVDVPMKENRPGLKGATMIFQVQ